MSDADGTVVNTDPPPEGGTWTQTKGQYGYGSKGKQKRLRIFSYVVKGILGAMFAYGGAAAAGLVGGGAAAGGGAAGGGAAGGGAAGGAAGGVGGEGALAGLGGVEPISYSGFTAAEGGIGSLGSGWGSSGVVAGEGGAGAAGGAASPAGLGWQDYARMGMRAKDALSQPDQQATQSAYPSTQVQQYSLPEDDIDERAVAMRQATALRSRIAMLRARLAEQEGA